MPSVAHPQPLPERTTRLWTRPESDLSAPIADAIRAVLEAVGHPFPLPQEVRHAARIALGRLDPLIHAQALDMATQAVSRRLRDDPALDARVLMGAAVYTYLTQVAGGIQTGPTCQCGYPASHCLCGL